MEAEHCNRAGFDHVFTTSNYRISSTPKHEWELATGQKQCSPQELRGERRLKNIQELLELDTAKDAGLTWPEVIAVVLYTGPMVRLVAFCSPRSSSTEKTAHHLSIDVWSFIDR
jgi:hypothetical protein